MLGNIAASTLAYLSAFSGFYRNSYKLLQQHQAHCGQGLAQKMHCGCFVGGQGLCPLEEGIKGGPEFLGTMASAMNLHLP